MIGRYHHAATPLPTVLGQMSNGSNPFYWMTESMRFTRICARKYPVAGWTLPTVISFGAGLLFMEYTNPTATATTEGLPSAPAPVAWKYNENKQDPYDQQNTQPAKPKHSTWQAQYVQDMLDGLKNKTTEQKLDDAFYAMDQIFLGKNNEDI